MAELLCATTVRPSTPYVLLSGKKPGVQGMHPVLAADPRYNSVLTHTQVANGRIRDSYKVFRDNPEGWRRVIPECLVLKRLAEAGLIATPVQPRPAM